MKENSREAFGQRRYMQMFRLQQLPKVRQTSTRLQDMIGIESGTRMLFGGCEVKLWKMPAKPKTFLELMRGMQKGQPKTVASAMTETSALPTIYIDDPDYAETRLKEAAHGPSYPGGTPEKKPLPNRKRRPEDSPQKQNVRAKRLNQESVDMKSGGGVEEKSHFKKSPPVSDHEQLFDFDIRKDEASAAIVETSSDSPQPGQRAVSSLFPSIAQVAIKASPPPRWIDRPDPSRMDDPPFYWDCFLSQQVCEWLEDPSTTSQQSDLAYVDFNTLDSEVLPLRFNANPRRKLKVTRMTISSEAETESKLNSFGKGQPEILDWIGIECRPVIPRDPGSYWLVVFSVAWVTEIKKLPERTGGEKGTEASERRVWVLGEEGRVPLIHGRGIPEHFLDDFIKACIVGKGKIEVGTAGPSFETE